MKRKEPQKKVLEAQNNDKCSKGNSCDMFCINLQCKKKSYFICGDKKCQCRKQHFQCQKGQIDHLRKSISSKLFRVDELKNQIQKVFDQIIDQISSLRDSSLIKIQKIAINSSLNQIQRKFSNQFSNFSELYLANNNKASQLKKKLHKNQNQLQIQQMVRQNIDSFQKTLKYQIQNLNIKLNEYIYDLQNTKVLEIDPTEKIKVIGNSNILKMNGQFFRLIGFFSKKILSIKLLFKASEKGFEIQRFRQRYGTEQNTITICLTNKDKIIGGYTPLAHFDSSFNQYKSDYTGSSFLFSLTNNDKFVLKNKAYAIKKCMNSRKIWFGYNGNFVICDKANSVNQCQSQLKQTYNYTQTYSNSRYQNNTQSYVLLNGNDTKNFTVKQWQVWKVQFLPQNLTDQSINITK